MDYFLDLMTVAMMHPFIYIIVFIISVNVSILQWFRVRRDKSKKLLEKVAIENKKVDNP